MKLDRLLLLPLVVPVLAACSDPPSAPPEAAAYITVFPAQAGTCSTNNTHGLLTMPLDQRVYDNLNCNLNNGCKPDGIVAVDGDTNTLISCSVSPTGDVFAVSANFQYQNNSISFSGQLAQNGGTVTMNHYYVERGIGFSGSCKIDILQNQGAIAGGKIWARFRCDDFKVGGAVGGGDCAAEGAFLFQRCEGG